MGAVGEGGKSLDLGSALNAISLSPNKSHAFVVGRDVLKIISIRDGLRTTHNLRPGKTHMNYTGNDCAWNPLEQSKNLIATAATNGAVVIWNIVRDAQTRQEMILTEHTRAVNRVSWHPENSHTFLTGSQDGTMKLWDMREKAVSKLTFNGHAESVRDVQFSPFYPNYFAAGFDNGNVQIWDMRKNSQVKDALTAHQALVLTVDWHPEDKNLIATGGRDRMVKVWDLTSQQKSQPVYSIQTISSVARVKWRPNHKYHIASCPSSLDFRVHIWDVRTPYIPIGGLVGHRDVATGLVWSSGHSLLSCSKDSSVIMHDTALAERPATTMRTTALSWSVNHELSSANDPIVRADVHDLSQTAPPPPPPLFNSKMPGGVSFYSSMGAMAELGPSFDSSLFVYFAKNYKLLGASLSELCEHNFEIAAKAQQHQIAQVWQLIKLFYDSEFDPMPESVDSLAASNGLHQVPHTHDIDDDALGAPRGTEAHELFDPVLDDKQHGEYDLHDAFLRSEAVLPLSPLPLRSTSFADKHRNSPPSPSTSASSINPLSSPSPLSSPNPLSVTHTLSAASPPLALLPPPSPPLSFPLVDMWDHSESVLQLLEYFAERGDVQSCVAICTVLGTKLEVPRDMFLRWTSSYIELLQRHKLWTVANQHVKYCPERQISQTNQSSTTIHTGCAFCGKPLLQKGWACEKCKKLTGICSICQQPVKGMYAWCQGCGHGGHLAHIREWFEVQGQKLCPGGCSHICTYKPTGQR